MVQDLYNNIERLKAEVARLRGKLDSIAVGNQVILNPNVGNNPIPPADPGALIYGTAGSQWGRRAIGAEGDVLQVQSGFPVWDAAPAGTPSTTVTDETTYGISPDPGASTDYSRGDHTHGSPADPWSGAVSIWIPDAPPASAGADDDEFADNSGGVPGGWTEVDFGTGLTVIEDEAGLKLISTAAQGNAGIYKAIPAGNFTIWTKVSMSALGLTDFVPGGLVLWQDATSSTGDLRVFYLESSAADVKLIVQSWTAYNAFSANLASFSIPVDTMPSHAYLRIRRTSTTYAFDASLDGIGWFRIYNTAALGITPTHYGPAINTTSHAATVISGRFPFFRYVSSDVGVDGLMSGDRIKIARN